MAKATKGGKKGGRREKKNVPHAVVHIKATFNNTTITFADPQGNDWYQRINAGDGPAVAYEMIGLFANGKFPDQLMYWPDTAPYKIEIPTPRWSTYDAFRFGVPIPDGAPVSTQERAYTSPIWYTP